MRIAAGLVLAAVAVAHPAAAAPQDAVVLMVMNCGTATPPIDVEVNGKALTLIPAAARDDSIELCYDAMVPLPPAVRVRLRRGGTERVFDLKLAPDTRAVTISASDMTARTWNRVAGID